MFELHISGWGWIVPVLTIAGCVLFGLAMDWACRRFGVWTGIHWGGKDTEHPGWWKFRNTPDGIEYRPLATSRSQHEGAENG